MRKHQYQVCKRQGLTTSDFGCHYKMSNDLKHIQELQEKFT